MTKPASKLAKLLDRLENFYGKRKPPRRTDPYEMILYTNCGYPATDASCTKGFDALKKEVGLRPDDILAAPDAKLTELMRLGGIIPVQRNKHQTPKLEHTVRVRCRRTTPRKR